MITATILNYKRPENFRRILPALLGCPLISEIFIWNNRGVIDSSVKSAAEISDIPVTVFDVSANLGVYPLLALGLLAKNSVIWSQGDDWVVSPPVIRTLSQHHLQYPESIHGIFGRDPTRQNRYADEYDYHTRQCEMVLNSACIYPRLLLPFVFQLKELSWYKEWEAWVIANGGSPWNGEDIMLSYVAMNLSHRKNFIHRLKIEALPDNDAICKLPFHYEARTRLMQLLRTHFLINV